MITDTQNTAILKTQQMKILIIGTGAIGGVCAAILAKNNYHTTVVCKYPDLAVKIIEEGLKVIGI